MAEKIKINPKWDRLTRESTEALNAGTTYGKYKAAKYAAEQQERERKEGEYRAYLERIKNHKDSTKAEKEIAESAEKGGSTPENKIMVCLSCGERLTGKKKRFCSEGCRYLYYREEILLRNREAVERRRPEGKKRAGLTCQICGKPIRELGRRNYCSEDCAREGVRQKKRKWREQKAGSEDDGSQ